jgi:hypothetical protein
MAPRKQMPCKRNPRTCPDAPMPKLAHGVRNPMLRWGSIERRLKDGIAELGASLVSHGVGSPQYEGALDKIRTCLAETRLIFKTQEAALSLYAGKGGQ